MYINVIKRIHEWDSVCTVYTGIKYKCIYIYSVCLFVPQTHATPKTARCARLGTITPPTSNH